MIDNLELFESIINNHDLKDANFILVFSHIDLFEKKIKQIPISVCPLFNDCNDNMMEFVPNIDGL